MIDDESEAIDQFNQKLAVDPKTGMLGLTYYRTGSGTERTKTNLMFRFSTDAGGTWSKATQVTSASTDETAAGYDPNQYGDYNGLSACLLHFSLSGVQALYASCKQSDRGAFLSELSDRRSPYSARRSRDHHHPSLSGFAILISQSLSP